MPMLGAATRAHRGRMMSEFMHRQDVDALVLTSSAYVQYATNFAVDVETWERPVCCLVTRDRAPQLLLNELSINHWRFGAEEGRLWADDPQFYAEHQQTELPTVREFPVLVANLLRNAGLNRSRIGVEGELPREVWRGLPDVKVVDVSRPARDLRAVKHAEEIAVMRRAGELTDWGQDRYRENIRPGRLVQELDASMAALIYEEAARRFPGEDMQLSCWTLSGPASAAPHGDGRSVGARIENGHVLVNIIEPRLAGLVIENERTWFCGRPSIRQVELFEAARAATEAGCNAAVAGDPVCAIDAATFNVFERAGLAHLVRHRTGHGMGIACHEYPEDMAFNQRALMSNEVYSVEPGIYEWGLGGFRHDDTVVVGDAPEVLTKAPKDLASQTVI